ncbi:MAG: putative monovalent cation/H+ antiporter subunit A [Acidobacteriota bacterium]
MRLSTGTPGDMKQAHRGSPVTSHGITAWVLAAVPFLLLVYFGALSSSVVAGRTVVGRFEWAPGFGLALGFRLDSLSLLFALLVSGIGSLVLVYASDYLRGHPHLPRFYAFLLLFMVSMLGLVLSDNIILLFIFWELTSVSSYLLIGFEHRREEARKAALQSLLVTGFGGLSLLSGLLLMVRAVGSFEISELLARPELIQNHAVYPAVVILVLLGAFTKSAQFPFHFWLPNAMETPAPVSAYLHSATMVKAGIYLLARLHPALGGTEMWVVAIVGVGAATMLTGAFLAYLEADLKRILAYSTVSALGFLTLLAGLGSELAIGAMMVHLVAHALYKGALFLVAGAVAHAVGTRQIERLGGLRRVMPVTASAGTLAALSMAGIPPLLGFYSKELIYEAAWHGSFHHVLVTVACLGASILLVSVALTAGVRPFVGKPPETAIPPHEGSWRLWLGPVILAGLGLAFGLVPASVEPLLRGAVSSITGSTPHAPLKFFHGLGPALLLGILTIAGGLVAFRIRAGLGSRVGKISFPGWGPSHWYDWTLQGVNRLALFQTRILQSGYLRYYLLTIITTTVVLAGYTMWRLRVLPHFAGLSDIRMHEAVLAAVILAATAAAVRSESRLAAVAALGIVGLGVALIFALFGAPDLAMTQFLVETLTVILLVLVLYRLPRFSRLVGQAERIRDLIVAGGAGAVMTLLILAAQSVQLERSVSRYFIENSLPHAFGRNVVNVILVDFRGLDTLGEITVLATAGIGVYAILKLRPSSVRTK